MTTEDFTQGVFDMLWNNHVMDVIIVHGMRYVHDNLMWIQWEFNRKLQRMTPEQWEQAVKDYIENIKRCKNEILVNTSGRSEDKEEQPKDIKEQ